MRRRISECVMKAIIIQVTHSHLDGVPADLLDRVRADMPVLDGREWHRTGLVRVFVVDVAVDDRCVEFTDAVSCKERLRPAAVK